MWTAGAVEPLQDWEGSKLVCEACLDFYLIKFKRELDCDYKRRLVRFAYKFRYQR